MRNIYLVRHCKAEGQHAMAPLTNSGFDQADVLSAFFSKIEIDQIVSSPFIRAIQSVEQISERKGLPIRMDKRLSERVLSTANSPDWLEKLKASFNDLDIQFEGGETSREAMERAKSVMDEILKSEYKNTIVVTHGNLMSLLLKSYDNNLGFECWKKLSNPDVFLLSHTDEGVTMERVWQNESKVK